MTRPGNRSTANRTSSFIRTIPGSGVTPDLLTLPACRQALAGLVAMTLPPVGNRTPPRRRIVVTCRAAGAAILYQFKKMGVLYRIATSFIYLDDHSYPAYPFRRRHAGLRPDGTSRYPRLQTRRPAAGVTASEGWQTGQRPHLLHPEERQAGTEGRAAPGRQGRLHPRR